MAVSASAQVRALAEAVATAFAAADLTDEEKRPLRVEHTDLPWQCPPLITHLELEGPLQEHFDVPLQFDEDRLHAFWVTAMEQMWTTPSTMIRNGNYAALGRCLQTVKVGQRALRFSTPMGAPACIHESAGIILSLEVAHCAMTSVPMKRVYADESNYIVETEAGMRFGVENGRPLVHSLVDYDARGQIAMLLESPRGEISYHCYYDQIASTRSILHTHADKFKRNFEELDMALQALRYLSIGTHCPQLVKAMMVKPMEMQYAREIEALYRESIEMVRSNIPDRAKLQTLHATLVPVAMSIGRFRREIFSSSNYPFSLAPGRLDQIESNLIRLYQSEVPHPLQREI